MKLKLNSRCTILLVLAAFFYIDAIATDPANPNATPEARALLKYIQGLSGKYILSGQHNYPATGDRNTLFAADYIGKTPVIWSQDFGFSAEGDKDSYKSRPAIIEEAIRQHKKEPLLPCAGMLYLQPLKNLLHFSLSQELILLHRLKVFRED